MLDGVPHQGCVMTKAIAVHLGIDRRGFDRGVEGLDVQAHLGELGLHPFDLGAGHFALGLGEIEHRRRIGLKLLGPGQPQF